MIRLIIMQTYYQHKYGGVYSLKQYNNDDDGNVILFHIYPFECNDVYKTRIEF